MFIKTTRNQAGQVYHHLVESYWQDGKSQHRTLLSLGRADEGKLDQLAQAISRHKDFLTAVDLAKEISADKTFILGPLVLLERLFDKLGINATLQRTLEDHSRVQFDLKRILFTMVACRFIKPGSKLKIFEHWRKKLYPKMILSELSLQQTYRTLDFLAKHKEEIELSLYQWGRDLLSLEVDVVLYDLTTLRFESTREDIGKLRRFGYSKEMRTDCTQLVLGLLVDTEGIPLGFEVYPGNTFEGETLEDIVEKMRNKFKVRRFIFVADRGLFSSKNLEALRGKQKKKNEKEGEFIVGMKLGVLKKRHAEFYDLSRFTWIDEELAIYETSHEGDRCIITWSKTRADRDQQVREDILNKIRKKLSSKKVNTKKFVSNRNYKRYLTGLNEDKKITLNEKAILEDAKKDGFFGVLTNVRNMSAVDVVMNYKNLWVVEDAFGEIKGNLKARPVFHWTDKRIVGHLMMCFLSYLCEAHMTKALRESGAMLKSAAIDAGIIKPRPLTPVEAMEDLREVRAIPVKVRQKTLWIRTDINGNATSIFNALRVKIPPRVLMQSEEENLVAQTVN